MEYATLQNGLKMPMEGFGVFQVRDKEECKRSVLDAIRTGYRLIDTAASYTNEDAVGEAVREAIAEGIVPERSCLSPLKCGCRICRITKWQKLPLAPLWKKQDWNIWIYTCCIRR